MSYRQFTRAAIPAACVAFIHSVAMAQSAPAPAASAGAKGSELQQVQVTGEKQPYRNLSATGATKTDTLLKDLPQSVRVLTADLLKDAGVTKLADALDLGSGISRQNNFGGVWDSYSIRGFTGDPNFGSDYMVNGFNYSRGYNGMRDSANTASVEVLKGPASALYGRGEPGGTINITTKKPLFQPSQTVELSAGSYDSYRATADLTGPINERFAYRVNAAYEKAKSWRDTVGSERYMVTPSFIWLPTPDTTVSYEIELAQQKANFDRGVVAINGKLGVVPRSAFYGEPNDGKTRIDTMGHQIFVEHYFNDRWSVQGGFSFRESSLNGASTEARFLQADQRTLVRQRRSRANSAIDLAGRFEVLGKIATGPVMNNILVGVDAYNFTDKRRQFRVATSTPIDIYNPIYGATPPAMALNLSTLEKQRSESVYAQDQIDLSDQWKVMLGVRHDKYAQSLLNQISNTPVAQTLSANTPRVGVVWEPLKWVSVYATASKSFRPNSGVSRTFQSFQPERGRSVEAGLKVDSPDGKITSTLAFYKINKNNVLTPDPIDPNNFSITAGSVESKGVEFDLSGEVYPTWRLSSAYAFTDAKVTQDNNAFLVGRQLANVPRNSANLLLVKSLAIAGAPATLGGGLNYQSAREGAVAPTAVADLFKLPSFVTAKVVASYTPTKHWRVSADVENLFNRVYYTNSYSQVWVYPGSGRRFTVSAQYKF